MCFEGLQRSMLLVNGLWDFLSVYCISFTVDFLDEYEAAQNDSVFTDDSNWSPSSWHRYECGWQERVAFMHTGFWQKSGWLLSLALSFSFRWLLALFCLTLLVIGSGCCLTLAALFFSFCLLFVIGCSLFGCLTLAALSFSFRYAVADAFV